MICLFDICWSEEHLCHCRIGALLERVDQGSQVLATEAVDLMEDVTVARRDSDVTAWVNVIHGCNERCTYCVVPNTRGVEQSRWPQQIKVIIHLNTNFQNYRSTL